MSMLKAQVYHRAKVLNQAIASSRPSRYSHESGKQRLRPFSIFRHRRCAHFMVSLSCDEKRRRVLLAVGGWQCESRTVAKSKFSRCLNYATTYLKLNRAELS